MEEQVKLLFLSFAAGKKNFFFVLRTQQMIFYKKRNNLLGMKGSFFRQEADLLKPLSKSPPGRVIELISVTLAIIWELTEACTGAYSEL